VTGGSGKKQVGGEKLERWTLDVEVTEGRIIRLAGGILTLVVGHTEKATAVQKEDVSDGPRGGGGLRK